jgi:hypothetical protein
MRGATDEVRTSRLTHSLIGLATLLLFPLSIINLCALPVGAIWLLVLGRWKIVLVTLAAAFLSPKVIGLVTHPLFWLQVLAARNVENRPTFLRQILAINLFAVSLLGYAAVLGAWCLLSLVYVMHSAPPNGTIPSVLLAFSVGVWPPQGMSSFNPSDRSLQDNLCLLCTMTQMCAICVVRLAQIHDPRWYITSCLTPLVVFVPVQVAAAWASLRARV